MQPFVKVTGVAAPMDRVNVDTDQICPAEFLKRIERTGFGAFLFNSWKLMPDKKTPNPEFVLNAPQYQGSSVLIAGKNFGCGSSREHAVWALADYGFRAIIAPSFAEIFHKNCFENGLCPVLLPEEQVEILMERAKKPGYKITVDLESCIVSDDEGAHFPFVIHQEPETHSFRRYTLLNGLDEVGQTLQHEQMIHVYEEHRMALGFPSYK